MRSVRAAPYTPFYFCQIIQYYIHIYACALTAAVSAAAMYLHHHVAHLFLQHWFFLKFN